MAEIEGTENISIFRPYTIYKHESSNIVKQSARKCRKTQRRREDG